MKIKFTLILLVMIILSNKEDQRCRIIGGKGVNTIVAGESTVEDVMKEFGKTKTSREWVSAIDLKLIGHFDHYLNYKSEG